MGDRGPTNFLLYSNIIYCTGNSILHTQAIHFPSSAHTYVDALTHYSLLTFTPPQPYKKNNTYTMCVVEMLQEN